MPVYIFIMLVASFFLASKYTPLPEVPYQIAPASDISEIAQVYQSRTWRPPVANQKEQLREAMATRLEPQPAKAKIIGTSYEDSVASLANKIWLIDNARHTIDIAYYIYKQDLAGNAILGALCEAVKRGVDVRIMVDSVGSFHPTQAGLKALLRCADNAGSIKDPNGQPTEIKARVQAVVFNALSNIGANPNRRSHDKLMIIDGDFSEHAWVKTGGRNISLAYYGFHANGNKDASAYKDVEVLLRPELSENEGNQMAEDAVAYFNKLFTYKTNKPLFVLLPYQRRLQRLGSDLETVRSFDDFQLAYNEMEEYVNGDTYPVKARLAHELGNLFNNNVITKYDKNLRENPNSIMKNIILMQQYQQDVRTLRLVSPYFFVAKYRRKDGTLISDEREAILRWLDEHPDNRLEIITNSVLTSDNFFTQAIIDMDTAPRLLFPRELEKQWQQRLHKSELNPELVESEEWQALVNNPRIKIYQTGRIDSDLLGGDVAYGKLHAKFYFSDTRAFIGTTNFDYRSRLYNNEMGYFLEGEEIIARLTEEFELLKTQSYLWGSKEWLAMRQAVRETNTMKSGWTKRQHSVFTRLRSTGLHWLF